MTHNPQLITHNCIKMLKSFKLSMLSLRVRIFLSMIVVIIISSVLLASSRLTGNAFCCIFSFISAMLTSLPCSLVYFSCSIFIYFLKHFLMACWRMTNMSVWKFFSARWSAVLLSKICEQMSMRAYSRTKSRSTL